jgi:hypothetical protein
MQQSTLPGAIRKLANVAPDVRTVFKSALTQMWCNSAEAVVRGARHTTSTISLCRLHCRGYVAQNLERRSVKIQPSHSACQQYQRPRAKSQV